MPSYTVTRAGNGHHFQLCKTRLRWKAVEAFARALPELGTVVTLCRGQEILRRSNEVVTAQCWICSEPIGGDSAPAIDSARGLPVCPRCVEIQRHARISGETR